MFFQGLSLAIYNSLRFICFGPWGEGGWSHGWDLLKFTLSGSTEQWSLHFTFSRPRYSDILSYQNHATRHSVQYHCQFVSLKVRTFKANVKLKRIVELHQKCFIFHHGQYTGKFRLSLIIPFLNQLTIPFFNVERIGRKYVF